MSKARTALDRLELFLDPARRDVEPRAGQIGHSRMFVGADRKRAINEAERTIEFVCSTPDVDRYGEIVLPEAFSKSLPTFMRNPVFPYGHHYDATGEELPTVGHWRDMRIERDALVGTAWFKPRGLGEQCWGDYLEGNMTSVSVAWLTRAWEMQQREIDGEKRRVRVFTEVDLLEVSAVLIPAQPNARIRAAHATAAGTIDDGLAGRIEGVIENKLNELLDAGPGGRLCSLIEDVASAMQGHAGHGASYLGDDLDDADDPAAFDDLDDDEGVHAELAAALRGVVRRDS